MPTRVVLPLILVILIVSAALAILGVPWVSALLSLLAGVLVLIHASRTTDRRRSSILARRAARADGREHAADAHARSRHLRGVIDRIDAPILVAGPNAEILLANASCTTLLGRRLDQLVGRTLAELVTQSALIACCERALAGEISRARVTLSSLARQRTFDASAIPLESDAGPRAVLTLRDVTDLAKANRLKTDFVANASHELRTPVAAIKGSVETLEEAIDEPAMRDRLIGIIARNARRLEELLVDLLELSRLEEEHATPPAEEIEIAPLLAEIASPFEARCQERSLRIDIDVSPPDASARLNRRLIELVLSNLIDNATRFARGGTTCTVRARPTRDKSNAQPAGVRFEVQDHGVGIPLADQARIFERFYQVDHSRTRAQTGGTGLGLSIVKHAVQILAGTVGVESILHQGSTFWVEIPAVLALDTRDRAATESAKAEPRA